MRGSIASNCRREPEVMKKVAVWTLAISASLAVFALYTRPDFMLTLANQVWACF